MNKFETDVLKVVTFIPHEIGNVFDFLKKNGATIQADIATGQTVVGDIGKAAAVLGESSEAATAINDANVVLGGLSTAVAGAQNANDLQAQVAVASQLGQTIANIPVKNPVSKAALAAGVNQADQIAGIIQAAATAVAATAPAA